VKLSKLILAVLFMVVVATTPIQTVYAAGTSDIPTLAEFASTLAGNGANQVTGIYAQDNFALPIIQQPAGQPGFVSSLPETLTQFSLASQYGSTGLLAHNTLAGASFANLQIGQYLTLIYGDGRVAYFKIQAIEKYRATRPSSPTSSFIPLTGDPSTLSATDLFYHVYRSDGRLVLQTCIEDNGNPSWGRLFILAEPTGQTSFLSIGKAMTSLASQGAGENQN
jgi:hypothetical protein